MFNFTVNYVDSSGVITAKQYQKQTAAVCIALYTQYLEDATITIKNVITQPVPSAPVAAK